MAIIVKAGWKQVAIRAKHGTMPRYDTLTFSTLAFSMALQSTVQGLFQHIASGGANR